MLLKQIYSFLRLVSSDTDPGPIAAGFCCGLILGFSPFFSIQTLLVFVILFLFRIQIGAALLSAFFFAIPAYLFDPLFDDLGRKILESDALEPTFAQMYQMPLVPLTRFNNSVVMGSAVVAIFLTPLCYVISKKLIYKYRETVVARIMATKLWKIFESTKFYHWYTKYADLRQKLS